MREIIRLLLPIVIAAVSLAARYLLNQEDVETPHNLPAVVVHDPGTSNEKELLIRYLFGFSGDSLISGAIGDGAERDTAEEVEAYISERLPGE